MDKEDFLNNSKYVLQFFTRSKVPGVASKVPLLQAMIAQPPTSEKDKSPASPESTEQLAQHQPEEEEEGVDECVCAICDNGGALTFCDGFCNRCFHAELADCNHLRGTFKFVEKKDGSLLCPQCDSQLSQCFQCGQMLDVTNVTENVRCQRPGCIRFYHKMCLHSPGSPLHCPLHSCQVCGQVEGRSPSLHLMPCRRCPRAWHVRCLPSEFVSESSRQTVKRVWGLSQDDRDMPKFLYCMDHQVQRSTAQPADTHLIWPLPEQDQVQDQVAAERRDEGRGAEGSSPEDPFAPLFPSGQIMAKVVLALNSLPHSAMATSVKTDPSRSPIPLPLIDMAARDIQRFASIPRERREEDPHVAQSIDMLSLAMQDQKRYLGSFIHGSRFTPEGRHFTLPAHLMEVARRLAPYVDSGDCIVDMCCGANDFLSYVERAVSCCGTQGVSFRSFDKSYARNPKYFTKSDWFRVCDLPQGDNLIIGLNPPFGVEAKTAIKFAKRAAEFRPKLIVLITPPVSGTPSPEYVSLWEDRSLLHGHAFYIPGSLSVHNKHVLQPNKVTPPLYFYSRADFVRHHNAIACEVGHKRQKDDEFFLNSKKLVLQVVNSYNGQSCGLDWNDDNVQSREMSEIL